MNSTTIQYEAARRPLTAIIEAVSEQGWMNPSPCDGWSARDVVRHLIETQRDFFTGRDLDMGAAPDINADPASAWRDHAKRVLEVISDDAVPTIEYDGYFGPTTVGATFEQFYIWDMVVHRWDIAQSIGADARLSDTELDRVEAGANNFGDALYMDGICRPGVEPSETADRQVRVLARLGRGA